MRQNKMYKLKFIVFFAISCFFANAALAEEYYWPRTYFFSAGFGAFVSKGDFNDRAITGFDKDGVKGYIHPPAIEFTATPDFSAGVNIRQFSLALNFQYWTSSPALAGFSDESYKQDTRIWRIGFDIEYHFFWPEFFQVGVGLGYSYSSVKSKNAAFFKDDVYDAEFMGSAISFITDIRYYISDNIAMVPAIKVYEGWYKNVHCSRVDNNDLDPYLWQTFLLASVSVLVQF